MGEPAPPFRLSRARRARRRAARALSVALSRRARLALRALHAALPGTVVLVVVVLDLGLVVVVRLERVELGEREDLDVVGRRAARRRRRAAARAVGVARALDPAALRLAHHARHGLEQRGLRGGRERARGGELDREHEEEVAKLERVAQPRHALALDRLHHARALARDRVLHEEEPRAAPRAHARERLRARAALELGAAVGDDERADVLVLELAALDRLLAHVRVVRVRARDALDVVREVDVLAHLPLGLVRGLLLERVEAHRPHDVARPRLDPELAAVEVLELERKAAQRVRERDRALDVQVVALALEALVRLHVELDDDVARVAVGDLVPLLRELDLVALRRALRDVHLEHLGLDLLAEGDAAPAAAAAARLRALLERAHLHDLDRHALAATRAARLDARLVDHLARDAQVLLLARVQLLERHLDLRLGVLALLHALAAAAAALLRVLEPLEPRPVVDLALLLVAEHVVRALDLLELGRVAALVRVLLHGELAVRLLDRRLVVVLRDAENLVQLLRVGGGAAAAAAHAPHAAGHPAEGLVIESRRQATEKHGAPLRNPTRARGRREKTKS